MRNTLLLLSLLIVLTGAGCSQASPTPPGYDSDSPATELSERSTALQFHIDSAANDLRGAVKDAHGELLDPVSGYIRFAQMTIPSAIEIANEDGATDDAAILTELDTRLTAALEAEGTLQELVDEALAVAVELENL